MKYLLLLLAMCILACNNDGKESAKTERDSLFGDFTGLMILIPDSALGTNHFPLTSIGAMYVKNYDEVFVGYLGESYAARDTMGKWNIKDGAKALESFYQAYMMQYDYCKKHHYYKKSTFDTIYRNKITGALTGKVIERNPIHKKLVQ